MSKFVEGQRVVLLPNEEEGWEREEGVVIAVEKRTTHRAVRYYIVELDAKYWMENWPHEDGIREVSEDQMEAIT